MFNSSLPNFLPDSFITYQNYQSDQELFKRLVSQPKDSLLFFEYGLEDVSWANQHKRYLELTLRFYAKQYYLGRLPEEDAKRLVKAIQQSFNFLKPFLFFRPAFFLTLIVTVEKKNILINPFLFGACSPVLKRSFKRECFEKLNERWIFFRLPTNLFLLIQEHVYHGHIPTLFKEEFSTIYHLMVQARDFEMHQLALECAINLRKYLNKQNVIDYFIESHKKGLNDWKKECQSYFNELAYGLFLPPSQLHEMKVEILNDNQETIELFPFFASYVTELRFSSGLENSPFFQKAIWSCPRLTGLDLSGSTDHLSLLENLPAILSHFNLSACNWVQASHLRKLNKDFPAISSLALANNGQLNYLAWGELAQFENLIKLDLSRCFQLVDEDIKQITKSLPNLQSMSIEECYQITDKGVLIIAIHCNDLIEMNINYCRQFSEKVVQHFISFSSSLKVLHCKEIKFSDKMFDILKYQYSQLEIES